MIYGEIGGSRTKRTVTGMARVLRALHLDGMLLSGLVAVTLFGLFVLWSAAGDNTSLWFSQVARVGIGAAGVDRRAPLGELPHVLIVLTDPLAQLRPGQVAVHPLLRERVHPAVARVDGLLELGAERRGGHGVPSPRDDNSVLSSP